MTDLSRLRVSLTKHNAHKVALLLKNYPPSELLDHLDAVHAEEAQAYKNLSVQAGNQLPPIWAEAKVLGPDAIDALVLLGIIFSHEQLIAAMANASSKHGSAGRIERNVQLSGKAYTNFVRILDQLGFATSVDLMGANFSLKPIFEIPGFAPLVRGLLRLKLKAAGWNEKNSVDEEAAALNLHNVFGITESEMRHWLTFEAQPSGVASSLLPKDEAFFQATQVSNATHTFKFMPGHAVREVEPTDRSGSARIRANQRHNDIQNRLYDHLCAKLGSDCVGTEVPTGSGTSIDLVTNKVGEITFYEIKTADSIRANIRQAISQLIEYSCWPAGQRANALVIVSHLPATDEARSFLAYLREEFKIQIFYRQFCLKRNSLIDHD